MVQVTLTLDEIFSLAKDALLASGADASNAAATARTVTTAERDGSHSHGLFRIPGYCIGLRGGKIDGKARPQITEITPAVIACDAQNGMAPLALEESAAPLIAAARFAGVAVLKLRRSHHFAALWPEVERLAEAGLAGLTCVSYKRMVAPAGGSKPLFGTNPIAFAWPRPGKTPLVFDMATAAMAKGDVEIAARDGKAVQPGTGLDAAGQPTTDPREILKGVLLPFGGYKGSAIATMVELLAGGLIGESFSFETHAADNNDGSPPPGGQFLLAMDPDVLAGGDWAAHSEGFFAELAADNVRLPGMRRHRNRSDKGPRKVNSALVEKIRSLAEG